MNQEIEGGEGGVRLLKAIQFAAEKHRHQRRKGAGADPYINHPIDVATHLAEVGGIHEPLVLMAAILHDTIEDTETTAQELSARFGAAVSALVQEVTDDKRLPKAKRKARQVEKAPHLSQAAKLIKLADKTVNVRDIARNPPASWSLERRRAYIDWAAEVIAGCRGVNAALEQAFDESLALARRRLPAV